MTMEALQREVNVLRGDLNKLLARLPRSTGRSTADRHDHTELRGRPIADTAPADGQVLKFSSGEWAPAAAGSGGGTSHVIQEDGVQVGTIQRDALDFRDGFNVADSASPSASRVSLEYATTAQIADVSTTESAGTSTTAARGDHGHAGAYTDAKARTAAKYVIYVPLGSDQLGTVL